MKNAPRKIRMVIPVEGRAAVLMPRDTVRLLRTVVASSRRHFADGTWFVEQRDLPLLAHSYRQHGHAVEIVSPDGEPASLPLHEPQLRGTLYATQARWMGGRIEVAYLCPFRCDSRGGSAAIDPWDFHNSANPAVHHCRAFGERLGSSWYVVIPDWLKRTVTDVHEKVSYDSGVWRSTGTTGGDPCITSGRWLSGNDPWTIRVDSCPICNSTHDYDTRSSLVELKGHLPGIDDRFIVSVSCTSSDPVKPSICCSSLTIDPWPTDDDYYYADAYQLTDDGLDEGVKPVEGDQS